MLIQLAILNMEKNAADTSGVKKHKNVFMMKENVVSNPEINTLVTQMMITMKNIAALKIVPTIQRV